MLVNFRSYIRVPEFVTVSILYLTVPFFYRDPYRTVF